MDGRRKKAMTQQEGWYSINMSRDYKYYIQSFSDYDKPPVYTLHEANNKLIRVIEDNAQLVANIDTFSYQHKDA